MVVTLRVRPAVEAGPQTPNPINETRHESIIAREYTAA